MTPWRTLTLGDGTQVRVHTRESKRRQKCVTCGSNADYLCDHPVDGGTCDAPMCSIHRVRMGADRDYCLDHK